MEIGSFIELDLKNTGEYYNGNYLSRLNSARAGIFHACKLYNVNKLYIPYYQCPTVSEFINKQNIEIIFYYINSDFKPLIDSNSNDSAFLLVNYFGIFSDKYIRELASKFKNVIIDNCPAFFQKPIENFINIYSPRKFFGVPDGCYLVGGSNFNYNLEYEFDSSSETASFLLKRIEKGCTAVYQERMKNEERINKSDILQMSVLTQKLLSTIDYNEIAKRRKKNFYFAHKLFKSINLISPTKYIDDNNIPMVYPLVIENDEIVNFLSSQNVYTGRWWNSVLKKVNPETFEAFLSKFMLPIPIDQRYSEVEITYIYNLISGFINK